MAFFKAKKEKIEKPSDIIGGSSPLESGVYDATVKVAYGDETSNGAQKLIVEFELGSGDNKRKLSKHLMVTDTNGKVAYETADGTKKYYKGFLQADALALFATDLELGILDDDLEVDETIIKDKDNNNKKVEQFTELRGLKVKLGIVSTEMWKRVQVGDEWVDSDELMTIPEIHTIFDEDGFTLNEAEEDADEPEFINTFLEAWKGKTRKAPAKKEVKGSRTNASAGGRPPRTAGASTNRRQELRKRT
jgi:hypothetical protein